MRILITGGAGFIGCNVAKKLLPNNEVIILDNLSRKGSKYNLDWIGKPIFIKGDVENTTLIKEIFKKYHPIDVVLHFAAQVSVVDSIIAPIKDFNINVIGTINLLEECRKAKNNPIFIFTSSNKVYGKLKNIAIIEKETRYEYKNLAYGINEDTNLDFYSPYACSKGAADQYVIDYARIYGMKTLVLRLSCIYGERQFGMEEQGWLSWFIISAILNKNLTIYGSGKQVRDILYIDDLVDLILLCIEKIDNVSGNVYNIGGGKENTISLIESIKFIEKINNKKVKYKFDKQREGDQLIYISDIRKVEKDLAWQPTIKKEEGIIKLYNWVNKNKELIKCTL